MCRRLIFLICVVLVPVLVGNAAEIHWTDADPNDHLWSTPDNWEGNTVPTIGDEAHIGDGNHNDYNLHGPIVDSTMDLECGRLKTGFLGDPCLYDGATIYITGGSLYTTNWFEHAEWDDTVATIIMSGGEVTMLRGIGIGQNGYGYLYMTSGLMKILGTEPNDGMWIPGTADATEGHVQLDGGTIDTSKFMMRKNDNYGTMDITEGTLIIDGDPCRPDLHVPPRNLLDYINNGWLMAYSGSGELVVKYDADANETTVIAKSPPSTRATDPIPRCGTYDVPPNVTLGWTAGTGAADPGAHEIYLGTDWDDVNSATTSSPEYEGAQDLDANSYDPSILDSDTTYYWRIDEVNDANGNLWKGFVWNFTVADYVTIDDMESYCTGFGCDNEIYDTWIDGCITWTGAEVTLGIDPIEPVRGGSQSMVYVYDGADTEGGNNDYYSESEREFDTAQDWTEAGVKILTLFFYGDPNNDANATEQMYVGLEDSRGAGSYAQVDYGYYGEDMNDIKREEWQDWNIALKDFSGVDMNSVKKVYIGFGIRGNPNPSGTPGGNGRVYFDDIRLYPPKCVPEHGPVGDLSGNCIVDLADVGIMADEWLECDISFDVVEEPNSEGLAGWWKLDENGGSTANDSSVYGNHGTISGSYSWVDDHNDGYAVAFTEGICKVPDALQLKPPSTVSASAWVNYSGDPGDSPRVVVKGGDNHESYCIEMSSDTGVVFYVGDTNGTRYFADSGDDAVDQGEWTHLAGTYDGSIVKCYVNGRVVATNDEAIAIALSQDPNDLGIGNRPCDEEHPFEGTIDDVRVYNYALSQAKVAWLATDGMGIVLMRPSPADLYNKEAVGSRAVNLRDYAVLMDSWGVEKVWPE